MAPLNKKYKKATSQKLRKQIIIIFYTYLREKYGIKRLKNTGRYYIARIVDKGGELIDEVLIDKQNGSIQSLLRRTGP
jgi:hypothetical protein